MKKRSIVLLCLMLACVLMLSGCGECKHEWNEADCLTAKTCTKCEVTEGEPLGHNWQAATCEAPETCSRCALTQGEKLEHVYGEWIVGETDMSRTCQNCTAKETAEIDRELYWKQKIEGHWDFDMMWNEDQTVSSYELKNDLLMFNLHADFENGSWWNNGEVIHEVALDFVEYSKNGDTEIYMFTTTFADNGEMGTLFYFANLDQIAAYYNDGITMTMTRNQELADQMTGLWAGVEAGEMYSLELKDDRTFVADAAGETFTGTWHLRGLHYYKSQYSEDVYRNAGLDLMYEKNGAMVVESHSLSLGYQDTPLEESFVNCGIGLKLTEDYAYVKKMNADNFALLKQANEEIAKKILGQWTSTEVYTYFYDDRDPITTPQTAYTIAFNEDGTFTASMDQDYAGTWISNDPNVYGNGDVSYNYQLQFDGVADPVYGYINSEGTLQISTSNNEMSQSVRFGK